MRPGRLSDIVIDPALPEALIYELRPNGRLTLVGVELVVPYALWRAFRPTLATPCSTAGRY